MTTLYHEVSMKQQELHLYHIQKHFAQDAPAREQLRNPHNSNPKQRLVAYPRNVTNLANI